MIISLVLGILLGGVSVIFVLQNTAVVTVMFLNWQVTGSLALILLVVLFCGIVMTLLVLLPSVIRDDMYLSLIKRQRKEVEDELATTKKALADALLRAQTPRAEVTDKVF